MSLQATDNSVPREMLALLSKERLIVRETQRAVTPFGGMVVFLEFLGWIDLVGQIRAHRPIRWRSHNRIDPAATRIAFLMAVLVGARRFVHANWLRGDRALPALLGRARFPSDDTIRNLFRRFGMGEVHQLYAPLAEWWMQRLAQRREGYSLDLDATVFERYGEQEGSLKGHNPRKHGRPQPSSFAGGVGGGSLPTPRLVAQWQLRASTRSSGVSQRSFSAVAAAPNHPRGACRCRLLR